MQRQDWLSGSTTRGLAQLDLAADLGVDLTTTGEDLSPSGSPPARPALAEASPTGRSRADAPARVGSPCPVEEENPVEAGARLVVLEAMRWEHASRPVSGVARQRQVGGQSSGPDLLVVEPDNQS